MEAPPPVRKVCVLTGGGDAPGLNAVLHGLVVRSAALGVEVCASLDGFDGLIRGRTVPLDAAGVRDIVGRGGSIIGCSNRANPYAVQTLGPDGAARLRDASDEVRATLAGLGVDVLVAVGGDGTMAITQRLAASGVRCVGVPKTIDNDLGATDVTFGYQSAVECVTWAIDRLHSTAAAHERVMIVEVMGRHAGWIAIEAGLAGSASVILIPEIPYDLERVAAKVRERSAQGITYSIVVVAEGARPVGGAETYVPGSGSGPARLGGAGERLQRDLQPLVSDHEIRVTVLGHLQRGGSPAAADRSLALRFGVAAAELAARGEVGRMVALRDGRVTSVPLEEATRANRFVPVDGELCATARALGIELGEVRAP